MIYYFAAIIWLYIISATAPRLPVVLIFPASIPIVAFSVFRGESGKDTSAYIHRFHSPTQIQDFLTIDSEPIISLIMDLSRLLFGDDVRGFFGLHALILFAAYFLIAKKLNLCRAYVMSVGPVFLIDGITNGMRITLAYHAILLGYAYGGHFLGNVKYWVVAFFAHVTSMVSVAISILIQKPAPALVGLLSLATVAYFAVFSGFIDLISLAPRIFSKIDQYSDLALPTWYSGVVDLLLIFTLLLVSIAGSSISLGKKLLLTLLSIALCLSLYLGIQQSLAVIRVGKLFIIAIHTSKLLNWESAKRYRPIILSAGILYTLNFLRQVSTDPGFLPYGE